MKKLISILTVLFISVSVINAQTLDEIVKKYTAAMKTDQLANVKTIKITGKMSAMGMEMPMTMYMKNPNKIKVIYNFSGQEMVSVYDGEKGYTMNPMTGSTEPVELTGEQLKQVQNNNAFRNQLLEYFKNGKLTLEGDDNVNGKPAFKLKATVEGANPIYMCVDKDSFLLVKTSTKVSQMGQEMDVDSFMSDYADIQGVVMPKKTTASSGGMEMAVITFDNIEVNLPMEDSLFKVK
jgi:outer membrane lipoprotein-sorting protein